MAAQLTSHSGRGTGPCRTECPSTPLTAPVLTGAPGWGHREDSASSCEQRAQDGAGRTGGPAETSRCDGRSRRPAPRLRAVVCTPRRPRGAGEPGGVGSTEAGAAQCTPPSPREHRHHGRLRPHARCSSRGRWPLLRLAAGARTRAPAPGPQRGEVADVPSPTPAMCPSRPTPAAGPAAPAPRSSGQGPRPAWPRGRCSGLGPSAPAAPAPPRPPDACISLLTWDVIFSFLLLYASSSFQG